MILILTFEKHCVCVGTERERVGSDIGVVVIMYEILKKNQNVCVCSYMCKSTCMYRFACVQVRR